MIRVQHYEKLSTFCCHRLCVRCCHRLLQKRCGAISIGHLRRMNNRGFDTPVVRNSTIHLGPSVCLLFVCLSVCLSVNLHVRVSVCLSVLSVLTVFVCLACSCLRHLSIFVCLVDISVCRVCVVWLVCLGCLVWSVLCLWPVLSPVYSSCFPFTREPAILKKNEN